MIAFTAVSVWVYLVQRISFLEHLGDNAGIEENDHWIDLRHQNTVARVQELEIEVEKLKLVLWGEIPMKLDELMEALHKELGHETTGTHP